jgi:hypothetical protein
MKKVFDSQGFSMRLKISFRKGKKILIVDDILFCDHQCIAFAGVEIQNCKGTHVFFTVENILATTKNLLRFLASSQLVKLYSHTFITKLKKELLFDSIVVNDLTGYCKALSEFESLHHIKI